MRPLKDVTPWPDFCVFDAEADKWVEVTKVCHVDELENIHDRSKKGNRYSFDNFNQYLNFLFSPAFEYDMVWSHWGGRYDDRFVICEAAARQYEQKMMISGNLIVVLVVVDHKGNEIKFCDSGRIMPSSAKDIGKAVGLPKLDLDRSKIGKVDPKTGKPYYSPEQIEEYCYRDCDLILKGLQGMREVLQANNCDFGFTLASIASRHVRRSDVLQWNRFYETVRDEKSGERKRVYSPKMLEADKFCLAAYFGGRNEVYKKVRVIDRLLYLNDVTSSYPASMTQPLPTYFKGFSVPPTRLVSYSGRPAIREQDITKALSKCGITDCTIWQPKQTLEHFKYPVLPVRQVKEDRVIYPWFTDDAPLEVRRGRWTNIELMELWKHGREHGLKIEIHGQADYEATTFLKPFVDRFFALRAQAKLDGDEFKQYAFKILLNSLYGKLIETLERRGVLIGSKMIKQAVDKYGVEAIERSPCPGVYFLVHESEGPFRHVAAGAYVTAYSRLIYLEGIKQCVAAGANVYYGDTDSLIIDKPVFGMGKNKELGKFGLECVITEAEFFASKVYKYRKAKEYVKPGELEWVYKAKGLNMMMNPVDDEIFAAAEAKRRFDDFTAPMRGEEAMKPIREGISSIVTDINAGWLFPHPFALQRQMKYGDTKRVHDEFGDSEPIILTG
jgi:DNA polymerase type B, organellar and viral